MPRRWKRRRRGRAGKASALIGDCQHFRRGRRPRPRGGCPRRCVPPADRVGRL